RVSEDKEPNSAFLYFVCWTDMLYLSYKVIMSAIGLASRMISLRMMSNASQATMQAVSIQMGLNSFNGLIGLILIISLAVLLWRMSRSEDE
ncbi:MAG: hypothetical protein IJR45_01495, partial [Firmicutes bacterium]|nr:hypothetical protein [Bacillota bacterium]